MPTTCMKRYGHEAGLSAVFRQWRATSHCNKLHGYALAFEFHFGCANLDDRNWVQDFGGLKLLKKRLEDTFDHKTVVAQDDPMLDEICALQGLGIADVIVVPVVGCEAFAKMAYDFASDTLYALGVTRRVWVERATCAEHDGNSATYHRETLV